MRKSGPIASLIQMGVFEGFRVKMKNPPLYLKKAIPASINFKPSDSYKNAVVMYFVTIDHHGSKHRATSTVSTNLLDRYFRIDTQTEE